MDCGAISYTYVFYTYTLCISVKGRVEKIIHENLSPCHKPMKTIAKLHGLIFKYYIYRFSVVLDFSSFQG